MVVGNLQPNNLVQVKLELTSETLNCVWAAGIISGLLGVRSIYFPPNQTRVLVHYTGKDINYIMGSINPHNTNPVVSERSLLDPEGLHYTQNPVYQAVRTGPGQIASGVQAPLDMVEGELVLENMMGVSLQLLTHLSALSAGDMARVEAHLKDDMVRVISGSFKHHSALGDESIYNDGGRLNREVHAAMFDHEAYGNLSASQERVHLTNPQQPDLGDRSQIDGFTDNLRARLSQYFGWLGDFVQMWVSDPPQLLGKLAADQLRAGKFRCHVNSDGSCLVQSVAEVAIEKVVRIPVPIRIRREDDPSGNRTDGVAKPVTALQQWKPSGSLFEMAFQLREYARWLSNAWTLGRFHTMSQDFLVPSEAQTPAPAPNSYEPDRVAANEGQSSWRLVYACFRILRDGSVVVLDGYGNSFTSTQTGVCVSSTQDLRLEAAGSIIIQAGRDIHLTARKNINLTAVLESVRIKSEEALQLLVTVGKCILDFVVPGWLVLRNGGLNVNGVGSINNIGRADFQRGVYGYLMASEASMWENDGGDHPHAHHVFPGSPKPQSLLAADQFQYQTNYNAGTVYQSLTQSALERNEQSSAAQWHMQDNVLPGFGAPWPGTAPVHKVAPGGFDLNKPDSVIQPATPQTMTTKPMTMKVQS